MSRRRKFSSEFKAQIVLEALKERETLSELAERFGVQSQQITNWKKEFLANANSVFQKVDKDAKAKEKEKDELFKQIGQLKVENEFLKKKLL